MKVKAVLFDLDGVITDTAHYHYKAWQQCANALGIAFDEIDNEQLKGVDRMHSLQIICKMGNKTLSKEDFQKKLNEKNEIYKELIKSITEKDILPNIKDFLKELQAKKIARVLCSASKNAPDILRNLGLYDCFEAIVDPATLANGKPAPDIFIQGAILGKSEPEYVVGIEDAIAGVQAIKAAGMYCIGIGGKDLKDAGADCILSSTKELNVAFLEAL